MINKKGVNPSQAFVFSELLCTRLCAMLTPQELVQPSTLQHPGRSAESGEAGMWELRGAAPSTTRHLQLGCLWVPGWAGAEERGAWPSCLSSGHQGGVYPCSPQEVWFLGRIVVSALRHQPACPLEQKPRSMEREGLSQECLFPGLLWLTVLEETLDPFTHGSCNWLPFLPCLRPGRFHRIFGHGRTQLSL